MTFFLMVGGPTEARSKPRRAYSVPLLLSLRWPCPLPPTGTNQLVHPAVTSKRLPTKCKLLSHLSLCRESLRECSLNQRSRLGVGKGGDSGEPGDC